MTGLRARSRWAWTAGVVLLLAGCASAPERSPQAVEAATLATLQEANEARLTALRVAVRSQSAGLITDAQFETVAASGRRLDDAILAAARALEMYLNLARSGAPASAARVDDAVELVKSLKAEMAGDGR